MSKNRESSSRRTKSWRLEIEALERRDCPAVTFAFDAGVLHITGDDGPNNIAIFQPRDRVVDVVGDGHRRTFSGVAEIFVDSKGRNDAVTSSKPKEIVVVGSKLNIDVGADNDTVKVDDGGPSRRPAIFNTALDVWVNLGAGADDLAVGVHHHDAVQIDVLSSDGGDDVSVGLLLPAVQKVREAAARTSIDLGGGNNVVQLRTENVDDVQLDVLALGGDNVVESNQGWGKWEINTGPILHSPSSRTNLMLLGDGNHIAFNMRGHGNVDLGLTAGSHNAILIGLLVPAVQTVSVTATRLSLDLGGGNNNVQVGVTGRITGVAVDPDTTFPDVDLDVVAAGGNNAILIGLLVPAVQKVRAAAARVSLDLGDGGNVVDVSTKNFGTVDLSIIVYSSRMQGDKVRVEWVFGVELPSSAGDDSPTEQIKFVYGGRPSVPPTIGVSPTSFSFSATAGGASPASSVNAALNLGPADDNVSITSSNVADLQLDITTGGGDDSVTIDSSRPGVGFLRSIDGGATWNLNTALGDGDDRLTINIARYSDVTAVIDAGEGDDTVRFKPLFAVIIVDLDNARLDVDVQLGAGDDLLEIDAVGYKYGNFIIDAGEGNDRSNVFAVWVTVGFFNTPGAAALIGAARLTVNAQLGAGDDCLEVNAAGYHDANIFINADDGHDAASNRLYVGNLSFDSTPTQLNIEAHLGDGDDRLDVDAAGFDDVISAVDGGTGADRIRHRMFAIIDRTQLNIDPARLNIAVDLGVGDDSVELETFGFGEIRTSINTGPTGDGLDSASVSHRSLRRRSLVTLHSFDLDGGMDTYDHRSWGYTVQTTVTGDGVVEFMFVA